MSVPREFLAILFFLAYNLFSPLFINQPFQMSIDLDIAVDNIGEIHDQCCCSICSENFDSEKFIPRLLDCGHTLCNVCIYNDKMLINNTIKCPLCMQPTAVPDGKVLRTNYTVLSMAEKLYKSRADPKVTCKMCDKKFSPSAVRICNLKECDMYEQLICLECVVDGGHGGHVVKYDAKMVKIRDDIRVKIAAIQSQMEGKKKTVLEKTRQLSRMAKALETRFSEVNVPQHIIDQVESLASEPEAKEYMEIIDDLADTLMSGCNTLAMVLDTALTTATQQFDDLFENEPIGDEVMRQNEIVPPN